MEAEDIVNIVEIQRKLTSLIGVSGREKYVAEFIYTELKKFVDDVWIDGLGNVLGIKKGSQDDGLRIMLDAHMDEVGIMVRFIEKSGFLRFSPLGGIDKRLYPGSRVLLLNNQGVHISGVIGMAPPHITSAQEREVSPDHFGLFIDIGADSYEQARDLGIDIGTTGVLDSPFEYLPKLGIMRGRAFDDRTGCNVLLQIAQKLSVQGPISNTILFAFTIGEEVGARGAGPSAVALKPDIGFAIENTIAADVPGVPDDKCPTKLGAGPALSVADNSVVFDEKILKIMQELAVKHQIPWQYKLPTFGGTDAGRFHIIGKGIPAAGVSVPCRYIHSPYGQLKIQDIYDTIALLYHTIRHEFKE